MGEGAVSGKPTKTTNSMCARNRMCVLPFSAFVACRLGLCPCGVISSPISVEISPAQMRRYYSRVCLRRWGGRKGRRNQGCGPTARRPAAQQGGARNRYAARVKPRTREVRPRREPGGVLPGGRGRPEGEPAMLGPIVAETFLLKWARTAGTRSTTSPAATPTISSASLGSIVRRRRRDPAKAWLWLVTMRGERVRIGA